MSADPRVGSYRKFLDEAKDKFNGRMAGSKCPRETLENFEMQSISGCGGFGKVFKAKHKVEGSTAAVKVMMKSFLVQRNKVDGIIREKEYQWSMQSAFIVSLLYAFKDHTYVYLVLEFATLSTLTWHIYSEQGIPQETARQLTGMIVLGIEYLHACNILYRDLKPDNVLVFEDGYVKLGDFGISIVHEEFSPVVTGTVPYMAPEMFLGQYQVDGVDWWALGVLVYEMFSKQWVFGPNPGAANREELIQAAIPAFNDANISVDVLDFVSRLLIKNTTKRLGVLDNGSDDVKNHDFFKNLNFYDLYEKKIAVNMGAFDVVYLKEVTDEDIPQQNPAADSYEALFDRF